MIVVCSKPGQLGNRLFIFATFIAFSIEYGVTIMNVSFDEYAEFFPAFRKDIFGRYPLKKSVIQNRVIRKWLYSFFYFLARIAIRLKIKGRYVHAMELDWSEKIDLDDSAFRKMASSTRLLLLQGWEYRCPETFHKHAGKIRQLFMPAKEHSDNVGKLLTGIRSQADLVVGIHIRQGDYAKFEGGKYYYTQEQYVSWMKSIQSLFPGQKVHFLVCSNVSIQEELFQGVDFTAGTGHFVEDLYAFSSCDYIAGPPSTYTIWASFYGLVPLYMLKDGTTSPQLDKFIVQRD